MRRTLAGLLLPEHGYRTMWTDRVVLTSEDEQRLTTWMRDHLSVTWAEHPQPKDVEQALITSHRPPLNVDGATAGGVRDVIEAARRAYFASAGPRPGR